MRGPDLVRNVRPRIGNVSPGAGEDALVVIAVEQRVLCLLARVLAAAAAAGRDAVRLEAGLGRLSGRDEQREGARRKDRCTRTASSILDAEQRGQKG